MIIAYRLILL